MTSTPIISEHERDLLLYLGKSLNSAVSEIEVPDLNAEEWERMYELAERHEVAVLLESIWDSDRLPEKQRQNAQIRTARTVHKAIRLQALNASLTSLLEKEGITAVTLKGYAVSRFYPVPEFRKTTDIDLFLFSSDDAKKAARILCENGFKYAANWPGNHHLVLISQRNDVVELHVAWADDFKEKPLNRYLVQTQKESIRHYMPIDSDGVRLYVYDTAYQGFYLLIHMLQHFVGSGFGLRNLCDWVVLWENCNDEQAREDFIKLAYESGTEEFAKEVTLVCTRYLGLPQDKSPFSYETLTKEDLTDELLRDILDAGEFGYSESDRMVGMDGDSLAAYIKEFHHQMHINFPKAGRVVFFWPVLWLATLIRFLNNNKKLNRAPVSAILKEAGKRGKLVRKITKNKKRGG